MHWTPTLRKFALKAASVALLGWLASCADSAGVTPRQSRFGEGGAPPKKKTSANSLPDSESTDPSKGGEPATEEPTKKKKKSGFSRVDGGEGDTSVDFPQFRFNGLGVGPCGKHQYPVVMNVTTTYSEDTLEVRKENGRVICSDKYFSDGYPDGECEKRANSPEKLAKRNVTNTFVRLSKDELKDLKDEGYDLPPYAVFSKEVRVSDGRVYQFSKPIPVGIVPASDGRYKNMEGGSWTATVSGSGNFEVVVEISKVSSGGGSAELRMTSTIPSAGANWSMYDGWVLPTEANYTIDTAEQSISQIRSKSKQSGGGDKCNQFEESSMTLTLCEKIQGDETTPGSCSFGQNPYP